MKQLGIVDDEDFARGHDALAILSSGPGAVKDSTFAELRGFRAFSPSFPHSFVHRHTRYLPHTSEARATFAASAFCGTSVMFSPTVARQVAS